MKFQLSEKVEFKITQRSKLKATVHNKSKAISRRYSKQIFMQPVQRLERYKAKIKQNKNPRGDGNGDPHS